MNHTQSQIRTSGHTNAACILGSHSELTIPVCKTRFHFYPVQFGNPSVLTNTTTTTSVGGATSQMPATPVATVTAVIGGTASVATAATTTANRVFRRPLHEVTCFKVS